MKVNINLHFDYDEKATADVLRAIDKEKMPMDEYIKGFVEKALLEEYYTIEGETITYDYEIFE